MLVGLLELGLHLIKPRQLGPDFVLPGQLGLFRLLYFPAGAPILGLRLQHLAADALRPAIFEIISNMRMWWVTYWLTWVDAAKTFASSGSNSIIIFLFDFTISFLSAT